MLKRPQRLAGPHSLVSGTNEWGYDQAGLEQRENPSTPNQRQVGVDG